MTFFPKCFIALIGKIQVQRCLLRMERYLKNIKGTKSTFDSYVLQVRLVLPF